MEPSEWTAVTVWSRSVVCPNDCGYMAVEKYDGGPHAIGVCTKCGHVWESHEIPEAASGVREERG